MKTTTHLQMIARIVCGALPILFGCAKSSIDDLQRDTMRVHEITVSLTKDHQNRLYTAY